MSIIFLGSHENPLTWKYPQWMTIPSGYVKIAIENDHRNSGFSHEIHGWIFEFAMLNYQRVYDQKIYGLVLYWWICISPWKYPQYPQSFMTRDPEYKYWGYRFIMIYPLGIPLAMIWLWPWKKTQNDRIMANLCQIPCKKIKNILSWWTRIIRFIPKD